MGIYEKHVKRMLDVILSGVGIVVLSPVILISAVLVRIKLGSPIVFKQKRPGRNEKIFELYKFRTMNDKKDLDGNLLPDEERLTKFGRGLRASSIDETLSLINILRGDMSIVGPRPLLIRYLPYYTPAERVRHSVRPGLTGVAQINGRNNLGWDERLNYDIQYVNNITFIGDVKIVLKTVAKVLKHSDIASGEQLIMQDLDKERAWMTGKANVQKLKNRETIE